MARNGKRLGFLPDWRIFTYFILLVNLVFLIWIIAGANTGSSKKDCAGLTAQECHDATNVGKGIGIAFIIILWALFDVIFGVLWLITNRKKRDCPVCGNGVKKGQMQCKNCGHDFRQQYAQYGQPMGQRGPTPPQGYPQQGYQQGPAPRFPDPSQEPPRRTNP